MEEEIRIACFYYKEEGTGTMLAAKPTDPLSYVNEMVINIKSKSNKYQNNMSENSGDLLVGCSLCGCETDIFYGVLIFYCKLGFISKSLREICCNMKINILIHTTNPGK